MAIEAPRQADFLNDVDDVLQVNQPRQQYRGVLVMGDEEYLGTTNNVVAPDPVLVPKITFMHIPSWKSYLQLSFYIRSGNGTFGPKKEAREPTDLHEAHVCLGLGCIQDIAIEMVSPDTVLPNLQKEKLLAHVLSQSLVYQLTITYNAAGLRQYGFAAPLGQRFPHPDLTRVHTRINTSPHAPLRLLINTNDNVRTIVADFLAALPTAPDYPTFYPSHPRRHFLQLGDYLPAAARPPVRVPASPTLDSWSEYNTVYGFGCIYEHEVAQRSVAEIAENVFKLRVMEVPFSHDGHYIGFVEKPDEVNARFEIGDRLKINFDPALRLETEDWTAVVIDTLPCAPQGDVCVALFRHWDGEANAYVEGELNPLPASMLTVAEAFLDIARDPAHMIGIAITSSDQTFRRQLVALHKLFQEEARGWWRTYLLGKNIDVTVRTDIYAPCPTPAMALLQTQRFNEAQLHGLTYLRELPNGIGIVTGPAATGKTSFIVTVVQPFLWSPTNLPPVIANPDSQANQPLLSASTTSHLAANLPSNTSD